MKDYTGTNWPWPDEPDALTATPRHHKLLFENESVRVLDTLIFPGEMTEVHTHKWPSSLYILSWSDFVRCDADGNVVLDSRNLAAPLVPATALRSQPLTPHTFKNVGTANLHVISVELKKSVD